MLAQGFRLLVRSQKKRVVALSPKVMIYPLERIIAQRFCSTEAVAKDNQRPSVSPEGVFKQVMQGLEEAGHTVLQPTTAGSFDNYGPIGVVMQFPNVSPDMVAKTFVAKPELLNISVQSWREKMELLVTEGVYPHRAFRILSTKPEILDVPVADILMKLDGFRQVGLYSDKLPKLISRRPELLTEIAVEDIVEKVDKLKDFFTNSQAIAVISNYPEILFRNFEELKENYEYLYFEMGCSQGHIRRSKRWITRSLQFIQTRHEFLVRTGAYRRPDPKRPMLTKDNPKLWDILDSSVNYFVTTVGGVTLQEYDSFQDLFDRQLRMMSRSNTIRDYTRHFDHGVRPESWDPPTESSRLRNLPVDKEEDSEEMSDYDDEDDMEFLKPPSDNEFLFRSAQSQYWRFHGRRNRHYDYKKHMKIHKD